MKKKLYYLILFMSISYLSFNNYYKNKYKCKYLYLFNGFIW